MKRALGLPSAPLKVFHQSACAVLEFRFRPQKTQHQPARSSMPKKYPGCTQTPRSSSSNTVRSSGCTAGIRRTAYQPPSTSSRRITVCRASCRSSSARFASTRARICLWMLCSPGQPVRHCPLHRRIHREERVGNDFEPLHRLPPLRPGGHDPCRLSFAAVPQSCSGRSPRRPATPSSPAAKLWPDSLESRNPETPHPQSATRSCSRHSFASSFDLPAFREVSGGIIRVNQHNGARSRRDCASKPFRINLPSVVVHQRRRFEPHIVEAGQKIKKRIARLRHQRSRSRDRRAAGRGSCRPRWCSSSAQPAPASRSRRDPRSTRRLLPAPATVPAAADRSRARCGSASAASRSLSILKSAACRIRGGQVRNRQPRRNALPMGAGQLAFFRIPVCSLRKAASASARRLSRSHRAQ